MHFLRLFAVAIVFAAVTVACTPSSARPTPYGEALRARPHVMDTTPPTGDTGGTQPGK